jgi:hypothetical protein
MRGFLRGVGWLLCASGVVMIGAYFVITYRGLGASFNFGDPAKFEFILVPFWQIGLAIVAVGVLLLLLLRWFRGASD